MTNDYDETFSRIRQMSRRHKAALMELWAEIRAEAAAIVGRFVAAGWSTILDEPYTSVSVQVLDLNGDLHTWCIGNGADLVACLRALEEAEKAAEEKGR